jgi:hypothetical protein
MVKVASEADKERVLGELGQVTVRYAVLYHRLAIENLIAHIPSAAAEGEPARTS